MSGDAPPPVRTSSGLLATALADAHARVVAWLEREGRRQHLPIEPARVQELASVAVVGLNDTLAAMHRAGVRAGRVAMALALGVSPPDGPETCPCPHCGKSITTL